MINEREVLREIITNYEQTGWLPQSINVSLTTYEAIKPQKGSGVALWLGWGIGNSVTVLPDDKLSDDEYKLVGLRT